MVFSLSSGSISSAWQPTTQAARCLTPVSEKKKGLKWKCCCGRPPHPSIVCLYQTRPEIKLLKCEGIFFFFPPTFSLTLLHLFFESGKAARFAEFGRPRTQSGHLIPIRYFSLLSCSSLSGPPAFIPPSALPHWLPHSWTLPSSLPFPRPCPHSLNLYHNL